MDAKPSLGESKPPYRLIPTISLSSYKPKREDIDRVLGTSEINEETERKWLNISDK